MTISGEGTEQLDIFCRVTGFTSDFLSFLVSCGTYSVLTRSPSIVACHSLNGTQAKPLCPTRILIL